MGKIWMPGGGGGADLDVVTAGKPDILAGKVIIDKDGNPLTGTMPDRGAINTSLGINGTYTIPEGYHNGLGKVTQGIATMGAQTINPTASQQIVSTSGKYLTGNVTVNGVSNLTAANIKKGVNVGGTVGTFQGYVPTATDLYLRGNNIKDWVKVGTTGAVTFDAGQITVNYNVSIKAKFNTTGFSRINIEGYGVQPVNATKSIGLYDDTGAMITYNDLISQAAGNYTTYFNLQGLYKDIYWELHFNYMYPAIYRIWLS